MDFDAVDSLMKLHSKTLGFLPGEALLDYLEKGGVLGAKTGDDRLVGYLLYAAYPDRFRIVHLCVSDDFVQQGIARRLLESLKKSTTTQTVIKLRCRRDFPAHEMWPRLGFVPLDEKRGRSLSGHELTLWCLTLAQDSQLDLFQAKTTDEALGVIIDTHIFLDFCEPDSDKSIPSKALLSDFLIDSLDLRITNEVFVEIDRKAESEQREASRQKAHMFPKAEYNPRLTEYFANELAAILPNKKPAQVSDIRHLAKAAASDIDIFVTRDDALLKKSTEIFERTRLQVLHPTKVIVQLHELYTKQAYVPTRVSGSDLEWCRVDSESLTDFPPDSLLYGEETKGKLREKLNSFLSNPTRYRSQLLRFKGKLVAIRILEGRYDRAITVHVMRVVRSEEQTLFGRFLISDTISEAIKRNLDMVTIKKTSFLEVLTPYLLDIGFTEHGDYFKRFCFSQSCSREQVLSKIASLSIASVDKYEDISDLELERRCSPLSLQTTDQKYFLIPVRPGYAMSLFDMQQSAADLFGGKTNILLRWDNVYYRRKAQHKMLKPPARILWYVSGGKGIIAVSHLDDVQIGTLKELYRKFRKLGILEWKELYDMCNGDPSREIMALKFSYTSAFRNSISLDVLRDVFKKNRVGLSVQSPLSIPREKFQELFQLGYPAKQS